MISQVTANTRFEKTKLIKRLSIIAHHVFICTPKVFKRSLDRHFKNAVNI